MNMGHSKCQKQEIVIKKSQTAEYEMCSPQGKVMCCYFADTTAQVHRQKLNKTKLQLFKE